MVSSGIENASNVTWFGSITTLIIFLKKIKSSLLSPTLNISCHNCIPRYHISFMYLIKQSMRILQFPFPYNIMVYETTFSSSCGQTYQRNHSLQGHVAHSQFGWCMHGLGNINFKVDGTIKAWRTRTNVN